MKDIPLLSVIVPVYNVEAYLARCVDSILSQTYRNLEVILVDDGAKDSSGAICDAYLEKDPRVRVIHKENGGLSSARNAGIDMATGEYITFVDSDDWIEPDAYESMLQLALDLDVKLVCGGRYDVDGKTGEKKLGLCPVKTERISSEEMVGRIFTWDHCDSSACDKMFHRSLLEHWRFPEGKIVEDVPVMYRIILGTDWVAMCGQPVYNYYHRHGSITTAAVSDKTFHFLEHTETIYPYILEHHPAIAEQAQYLRIRALAYSALSIEVAGKTAREQYGDIYRRCCRELLGHAGFVLKSPLFGKKERLTDLLLGLQLYPFMRRVYHVFR
ncbi:MAG: glycosyltransferase family 2 protein [Oscillospiraceae bacterium]|nr:glycosyltransferase family 2 protein [Oscillospiraceae bacterium]